jgi:type 1 glutamine amidotransferase
MKNSPLIPTLLSLLLVIPFSCKKYIQQQEQNALVSIVTKGTWRVTGYHDQATTNLTDSFAGYSFQFNENGTLYTVKYGQQTNGTWSANIGNKTITSTFPGAPYPINLLNYTWTITDSYSDSVAAKTAVGESFNILNLHKN